MAAATTRTAVQAAADAAVGAAQIAAPGDRANEGVLAARIALAAARSPVIETRTPAVAAEPERGQVQVLVFGGIISPVFGGVELSARACGPLDDIATSALSNAAACSSPLASGCRRPQRLTPPQRARLRHRRRGGDDVLMPVIVLTQMLTDTRAEQAPQATANRAARVAALCCYRVDGAGGAVATVRAGLERVTDATAGNRIYCNNDLAADANVVFIDTDDSEVTTGPVPPGGTAYVFLTCRIPPQVIGGFGLPGLDAERLLVGAATIDPFRSRSGA